MYQLVCSYLVQLGLSDVWVTERWPDFVGHVLARASSRLSAIDAIEHSSEADSPMRNMPGLLGHSLRTTQAIHSRWTESLS